MLQSAGEAISHDRHFVLKSDTKFTRHFVCDLSTRVSVLSAVTDVLKGDKLLKTRRPNFQIKAQRDNGRSRLNPESLSAFSVPLLPNTHVLQGCLAGFTGSSALSVQGGDGKLDEFDTLKL
jgi:hypothetical protein